MLFKKSLIATITMLSMYHIFAGEVPIDRPQVINSMEIAAVYLEPIEMEPKGMGLPAAKADVHLEADIKAVRGNKNGFGVDEWIPYLTVRYQLKNVDNGKIQKGTFMPMVADDGPHYGDNIKFEGGYGNYELIYFIEPPTKNGMHRHTDKATGVAKFWKPFKSKVYKFKWTGLK